ncbi:glycosyltransferase family 2 protein [Quadrisphaera setariae]|uniref:Glycosyltransferase family 2 protein n=1 Tax=Quadrisphaera setariae TaxID=2593304 RepID=A0A5C8ZE41_9ACTN|nr:glycosyltransferase family 2 protein [Quadrisphaera setariae]
MVSLLVPTYRRWESGDKQRVWGDLRVLLASLKEYAPGFEVIVAWDGPEEPRHLPDNPSVRLLKRPEGLTTCSEAWNWCTDQTDSEDLVFVGDDTIFHPDSLRLLLEDALMLTQHVDSLRVGMVGVRSNFVKGAQNIREANGSARAGIGFASEGSVVETAMIAPVVAWMQRSVFEEVGRFQATNWFQDDLISWDLQRLGYRHFVSRSYVHHVGQRGTGQGKSSQDLLDEGLSWLRSNRPDYLTQVLGIPA